MRMQSRLGLISPDQAIAVNPGLMVTLAFSVCSCSRSLPLAPTLDLRAGLLAFRIDGLGLTRASPLNTEPSRS
jgi:hypothetical protein